MPLTQKQKNDKHVADQKKLGRTKRSIWLNKDEFKKVKEFVRKLRNTG